MSVSCKHIEPLLALHIEKRLPPAYRLVAERHLAVCASCREALSAARATHMRLEDAYRPLRLDANAFAARVMASIPEPTPVRRWRSARRWRVAAVAAGLMLAFLAGWWHPRSVSDPSPTPRPAATGKSLPRLSALPDGKPFHSAAGLVFLEPVRPVAGRIVRLDGDSLVLNLGWNDGIGVGTPLMAYRTAGTGEGDVELLAGVAVARISKAECVAEITQLLAGDSPAVGDAVATAPFEALRERRRAERQADELLAKLSGERSPRTQLGLARAKDRLAAGVEHYQAVRYGEALRSLEEGLLALPEGDETNELRQLLTWYVMKCEESSGAGVRPHLVLRRAVEKHQMRRKLLAIELAYRVELGRKHLASERHAAAMHELELAGEIARWLSPGGPDAPADEDASAIHPSRLDYFRTETERLLKAARLAQE